MNHISDELEELLQMDRENQRRSRKDVRNLAGAFESGEVHISSDKGNDRAGYPEGYSPGRGKGAQHQ